MDLFLVGETASVILFAKLLESCTQFIIWRVCHVICILAIEKRRAKTGAYSFSNPIDSFRLDCGWTSE